MLWSTPVTLAADAYLGQISDVFFLHAAFDFDCILEIAVHSIKQTLHLSKKAASNIGALTPTAFVCRVC